MMKSTIRRTEYEKIYRRLDDVSPLPFDCGTLCGSVCCGTEDEVWKAAPAFNNGRESKSESEQKEYIYGFLKEKEADSLETDESFDEPEMGIYLLPGEEKVHSRKEDWLVWSVEQAEDHDFPETWKGKIYFVRCKTPPDCPREKRPIQCRTFPLSPHFTEDGQLVMVLNDLTLPYSCPLIEEEMELDRMFLEVTHACWLQLVGDPLIRDLVQMESDLRRENGETPTVVFP